MNLSNVSIEQLQRAVQIKEQIAALENQLGEILKGQEGNAVRGGDQLPMQRKGMSAAGKAKIAAAQKARWAKARGDSAAASGSVMTRRKMSPAAKAKIAAAARARWAKAKATGKKTL